MTPTATTPPARQIWGALKIHLYAYLINVIQHNVLWALSFWKVIILCQLYFHTTFELACFSTAQVKMARCVCDNTIELRTRSGSGNPYTGFIVFVLWVFKKIEGEIVLQQTIEED